MCRPHRVAPALASRTAAARAQIAWGMYLEGRGHIGELFGTSRTMAIMMIEDIAFDLAAGGDIQAAVEGVRRLLPRT